MKSPYNYCQLNPIGRIDPTGALDWEPVVSKNGEVGYRAEKGDNFLTFKSQYGLTYQQTFEIFNAADIDPAANDLEGQSINGSAVKKVTGSDVLKLNWNSSRATDQRKVYHIGFAMLYDFKNQTRGCGFTLNDYTSGMPQTTGANSTNNPNSFISGKNVSLFFPIEDGGKIPISYFESTASGKIYLCNSRVNDAPNGLTYSYTLYHPNGKKLSEQHTQLQKLMFTVPNDYINVFEKNYWRK